MFFERIKPTEPFSYRGFDNQEPLSSDAGFKEQFAHINAELTACAFSISPKQFSHRLVPAYLANTKIVGISSLQSVDHWIGLISLWIEGRALFLPHNISKNNLEELLQILKEYRSALVRLAATTVSNCRESAKKTIQEIQTGLTRRDTFYSPLGYTNSISGCGHAIPLKLRNKGKQVEALFLNLGEGLQMHPIVDWSPSGPRFHFQSFPVLIDRTKLASTVSEEVFTRLVRLCVEECLVKVRGYSAEDVYGPIYSLGTIQSSFNSKVDERSRKPQLGDICGDMAILLIIKDFLIDLGYQKNELQRLVTLEKLCDILFFYHSLCSMGGSLDEWILLKNGLKEFSIRVVKENKSVLSLTEIEFLHALLHPLFSHTTEQITKLKRVLLPIAPLRKSQDLLVFVKTKQECLHTVEEHFSFPSLKKEEMQELCATPLISSKAPAEIGVILKGWVKVAQELAQTAKCHYFVYRALCSLEIPKPDPEEKGFWDQVPDGEISEILRCFVILACEGVDRNLSKEGGLIYRNVLILSITYAIIDRLLRRKYPELKGFASPFYPSRFQLTYTGGALGAKGKRRIDLKPDYFEFWNLPLEQANTAWSQIRIYFERQQSLCEHTLFALEKENINIRQGVRDSQSRRFENREWTSIQDHLKFLENYLERTFSRDSKLSLEERYALLWLNPGNQYIPYEIETLYYFAYHAWHSFSKNPTLFPYPARVQRNKNKNDGGIEFNQLKPLKNMEIQALLGEELVDGSLWKVGCTYTENETQCLNYKGSDPKWNTQLTRQWCRIFSKRSLQISSLIQWMRAHLSLVCQKEIQQLIEVALFMPGLLTAKIKEEPSILTQLRELISQAFAHYGKGSLENPTSQFLMRLGIAIESYTHKPLLEAYETRLLEGIRESSNRSTLYYHLLLLYQIDLPCGRDSIRELIKAQFWIAYHEVDSLEVPGWASAETASPLERYHTMTSECFQEQEWLEQTFKEVFSLILDTDKLPVESCKGKYPTITKGNYSICVERGRIFRNSGLVENQQEMPHQLDHLIYIKMMDRVSFPALEEAKGLVWSDNKGCFTCTSDLNKIVVVQGTYLRAAKKFPFFKDPVFSHTWHVKAIISIPPLHSLLFYCDYYDQWRAEHSIVICKKGESRPRYIAINPDSSVCFVYKVLPDGTLGLRLVNLENLPPDTYRFVSRLGDSREVCVWINEETRCIEEIDFLLLSLTFRQEKGRFYCQNYPGFFLSEEQSLEEFNFFEGALVLENGGEKIILVPGRNVAQREGNFSTQINFKREFLSTKAKYYLYHLDEIAGVLVHPTSEGNLFLVLIFAMQMNYAQALFYLDRSRSFTSPNEPFFWMRQFFMHFKDQSPQALGFYLRLALHIIHSSQQVILSAYDKKERLKELEVTLFCKWLGEKFAKYLNIHSHQEISRIPEEIRLSREEELFLFEFLESRLKEVEGKDSLEARKRAERPKIYWPTLFDIRLSLLRKKTWSTQISPQYYPLYTANHLFSTEGWDLKTLFKLFPPNLEQLSKKTKIEFVRLTETDISFYFMFYYERARNGQAEIDLFYLARSNDQGFTYSTVYHLVLSYVQSYPDTFQDLVFGEDPVQNVEVFNAILSRVDGLYLKFWRNALNVQKFFFENTVSFRYQKSIKLSLDTQPILSPIAWDISERKIGMLYELQKSIFLHFEESWFETRHDHGKTVYTLKEGKKIGECLSEAKQWLIAKRNESICLKKTAESIANSYPEKDYFLGLRKMSSNLPEITMEGTLTKAYQNRNALSIKEANPSLWAGQIKELIFHTLYYHILRLHIHQLEQGIEALKKGIY